MAYENKYIQVDGLKTRYIEDGAGPAAILLHGASLGSSADVFERNLKPLASAGVRAIAYDQPGFGLTDNPTDYSVAYRRRFIMMFMDALGLQSAAMVGHSQAGNMAVANAFEHPKRISKIMILGTGSLLPPLPEGQKAARGPRGGRRRHRRGTDPRAKPRVAGAQSLQSQLDHAGSARNPPAHERRQEF